MRFFIVISSIILALVQADLEVPSQSTSLASSALPGNPSGTASSNGTTSGHVAGAASVPESGLIQGSQQGIGDSSADGLEAAAAAPNTSASDTANSLPAGGSPDSELTPDVSEDSLPSNQANVTGSSNLPIVNPANPTASSVPHSGVSSGNTTGFPSSPSLTISGAASAHFPGDMSSGKCMCPPPPPQLSCPPPSAVLNGTGLTGPSPMGKASDPSSHTPQNDQPPPAIVGDNETSSSIANAISGGRFVTGMLAASIVVVLY